MSLSNSDVGVHTNEGTDYQSKFHSDFDILHLLGNGTYGVVFEVKHKIHNDKCAIKRVDLAYQPSELMEREIKIRDCQHRNIVHYIDSWIEQPPPNWQEERDIIWKTRFHKMPIALPYYESVPSRQPSPIPSSPPKYLYIQMELCQKDNLADWLLKSDANVRKNKYLTIFKEIVAAVKYIGSKGLIYRDLKVNQITLLIGFKGLLMHLFCHFSARKYPV